jgi:hypothetical protein
MNLKLILFTLLLSVGCSHLNIIPSPTDEWRYVRAEENDAELQLTVGVEFQEPVISDEYVFLFKEQKIEPGDFYDFPTVMQSFLFDGEHGSSVCTHSEHGITSMTKNGVIIEVSKSCDPNDDDHGFIVNEEIIIIPFENSGVINKKNIHYKWTWKQINPNQHIDFTVKTPVD